MPHVRSAIVSASPSFRDGTTLAPRCPPPPSVPRPPRRSSLPPSPPPPSPAPSPSLRPVPYPIHRGTPTAAHAHATADSGSLRRCLSFIPAPTAAHAHATADSGSLRRCLNFVPAPGLPSRPPRKDVTLAGSLRQGSAPPPPPPPCPSPPASRPPQPEVQPFFLSDGVVTAPRSSSCRYTGHHRERTIWVPTATNLAH